VRYLEASQARRCADASTATPTGIHSRRAGQAKQGVHLGALPAQAQLSPDDAQRGTRDPSWTLTVVGFNQRFIPAVEV
jgi:hypothetical protein